MRLTLLPDWVFLDFICLFLYFLRGGLVLSSLWTCPHWLELRRRLLLYLRWMNAYLAVTSASEKH